MGALAAIAAGICLRQQATFVVHWGRDDGNSHNGRFVAQEAHKSGGNLLDLEQLGRGSSLQGGTGEAQAGWRGVGQAGEQGGCRQ